MFNITLREAGQRMAKQAERFNEGFEEKKTFGFMSDNV
jgi:hypothetical protein